MTPCMPLGCAIDEQPCTGKRRHPLVTILQPIIFQPTTAAAEANSLISGGGTLFALCLLTT